MKVVLNWLYFICIDFKKNDFKPISVKLIIVKIVKLREREGKRVTLLDIGQLRVGKGYLMVTVGQQG